MSNELVQFQDMSFEQIAALTGAQVSNAVYLPRLTINADAEDDDGNSVPVGAFTVKQGDVSVYSKTAIFRVFLNAYQYQEYDPSVKKYTNRSVIIKSFFEEAIDEKGGLSCGKIARKDLEAASDELKASQKNIKCNRLMYGLVSFPDAVTATGEKTKVDNLPVMLKLAGSNFMAPKDALDAITHMKHHFFQHNLALSLTRQKNGATVYYTINVNPNLKETVEFSNEDMETFKLFNETVERENNFVAAKWKAAKVGAITETDTSVLNALDLNDSIDDLLAVS